MGHGRGLQGLNPDSSGYLDMNERHLGIQNKNVATHKLRFMVIYNHIPKIGLIFTFYN